jgi:Zn-dependent protease with chaperone function
MAQAQISPDGHQPTFSFGVICAFFWASCTWACAYAAPTAIPIAEASSGLAFSESEVGAHAAHIKSRFLLEADAKNERGCALHCEAIAEVWNTLLPVIRSQQPRNPIALRLEIVNSSSVDALAFAEGTVILSEAFVSRLALSKAHIAFVLAHEASHVLLQHERQTLTSALAWMAPMRASSAAEIYQEMEDRYFQMDTYLSVVAHQTEFEADEIGLGLAAMAGYDPHLQLEFMQTLAQRGSRQSMLSTHPEASLRLGRLREHLPLAVRLFERAQGWDQPAPVH